MCEEPILISCTSCLVYFEFYFQKLRISKLQMNTLKKKNPLILHIIIPNENFEKNPSLRAPNISLLEMGVTLTVTLQKQLLCRNCWGYVIIFKHPYQCLHPPGCQDLLFSFSKCDIKTSHLRISQFSHAIHL